MNVLPAGKPSSRPGIEGLRFDLLARVIPGLVFMTLAALLFYSFHRKPMTGMAAFLLDVGHAWWVGLAVVFAALAVAYAIGQVIDALAGQWLIRRFALSHFAAAVPAESATVDAWDAMRACVSTQAYDRPETATLLRAQAESRSLTNLGVACLVFALAFAPSLCFVEGARQGTFMLYVYSSLVGGLVLLLAGYSCQRRRVAGVVALARSRSCACAPGGQCPFRVGTGGVAARSRFLGWLGTHPKWCGALALLVLGMLLPLGLHGGTDEPILQVPGHIEPMVLVHAIAILLAAFLVGYVVGVRTRARPAAAKAFSHGSDAQGRSAPADSQESPALRPCPLLG